MVSAFRFDEDAHDELNPAKAPNGRNLTFRDGAMEYNGRISGTQMSYVSLPSPRLPLRTFSFAVRFKPDPSLSGKGYMVLRSDAAGKLELAVESNGRLGLNVAGKRVWIGSEKFEPLDWTTIACGVDLDQGTLTAYIDGRKAAEESLPLSLDPVRDEVATRYWYFLAMQSSRSFHGLVDELLIFDRMLSPEEFAGLKGTRGK